MLTSRSVTLLTLIAAGLGLAGCGSMTGFTEAEGHFACKAPPGVSCKSVSGVYANAQVGNLPGLRAGSGGSDVTSVSRPTANPPSTYVADPVPIALPGVPIRTQPRMVRIWVAPWVDDEGDLHDQSYIYMVVSNGRWMVDSSRKETVQRTLKHLRAPANASIGNGGTRTPAGDDSARQSAAEVANAGAEMEKQ